LRLFPLPLPRTATRGEASGGTGFLIEVRSPDPRRLRHFYAVTNRHVVADGFTYLRLNLKNSTGEYGFGICPSNPGDWKLHEDGDDIAVLPIRDIDLPSTLLQPLFSSYLITETLMSTLNIGVGDDVFMIGRMVGAEGSRRNFPAARFGNIASLPTEPLYNPATKNPQQSFVVECHSISGYSGAPVFVQIRPIVRERFGELLQGADALLLGIDWGHLTYRGETAVSNTGMAGVVPAWKILDILNRRDVRDERERLEAGLAEPHEDADTPE